MKLRYWTAAEVAKLHRMYPSMGNEQLGERFGRSWSAVQNMAVKLGLKKDASFLNGPACRFQKGMVPWNLGKTGYMGANATSFSKGAMPHNHRPVGSERITKDGYMERKVSEPKRWRAVHVLNWEAVHGKVKRGFIVVLKDGNPLNAAIENLECISRVENMRRNTYHRYPKEIARLIQLRGALNRQINKRAKHEEQDSGSTGPSLRGNRKGKGRRYAAGPGKGRSRTGAGNHQQRQGGNRTPKGARQNARNGLHSRGRNQRSSRATASR